MPRSRRKPDYRPAGESIILFKKVSFVSLIYSLQSPCFIKNHIEINMFQR